MPRTALTGLPEPSSRAPVDSFLNSFAAEPATTSATWGAMPARAGWERQGLREKPSITKLSLRL